MDVHQHLWTDPLLGVLSARATPPRLRREGGAWRLELDGEPPSRIEPEQPVARAALVHLDGLDQALVALSSALGVEWLPPAEAERLLDAHAAMGAELPDELGTWAAVALTDPEDAAAQASSRLDGCAGLCVPAAALATPAAVERLGPLLAALEDAGAPLFVHPGPATAPPRAPAWWPALADYVAVQQAAWLSFGHAGRSAHPRLRVVFGALAGLAPLHVERIAARGGPASATADPLVFYETSSYGLTAMSAMTQVVGLGQLVHGSDRPVLDPAPAPGPLGPEAWQALTGANPARLLAPVPSHA
nr:amidohydrolase [Capillimicrobium parvum]